MAFRANPFETDPAPEQPLPNEPVSDVARSFTGAAIDMGAQAAGVAGALRRNVNKATAPGQDTTADTEAAAAMGDVQDHLNEAATVVREAMSPTGKAVANADWTTGEGLRTKLSHPVQALAQGAAELAPTLLAAAALPEGWAGVAAGSAFFGTQGVAQQMNATRQRVMTADDGALQTQVPLYRALREDYDEPTARQKLIEAQNDIKGLLIAGGANALAGGVLGHLLHGPATQGFLKSIGVGAGEAAAGLGVAAGGSEVGRQMGEQVTGERSDMDPEAIALAALNGTLTGGLLGGVAGAARGAALPRKVKAQTDVTTGRVVPTGEPDPAQRAALEASQEGTEITKPGAGTLAEQIAQEEQAPSQPQAAPPVAPDTVVPPRTAVVPEAPATGRPPAEVPLAPAPEPPAEVQPPAGVGGPEPPIPQPPVPLPPTDRTNLPPRKKLPTERTAVPVEIPLPPATEELPIPVPPTREAAAGPAPVSVAEAERITQNLSKREEPTSPSVVEPAPAPANEHIDALNQSLQQKLVPAEVTPEPPRPPVRETAPVAELVDTTKEGQKIFRNELSELVKEARAQEQAKAEEQARRLGETERKREARFNQQQQNEAKAKTIIEQTHPTDADELTMRHLEEQRAIGAGADAAVAREEMRLRAGSMLAAAENAGVRIPERTRGTVEQREAGEKNPTPYTSRLSEIKKFLGLVQPLHRALESKGVDRAKIEARLRELYTEHVAAERAIRTGDLAGAAERRLEANERRNARHRAGRVKEEIERTQAEKDELERLIREQGEEPEQSGSRSQRSPSKADHYAVPKGEPARVSNGRSELAQLSREFEPRNFTDPKRRAYATLLQQVMRKLADHVGDTEVTFVHDPAMKAEFNLGRGKMDGVFSFFPKGTTAEGNRGVVHIDNDIVHTVEGPRVVIHELVHAATNHAIEHNPTLRQQLALVHSEALAAHNAEHGGILDAPFEYGLHATTKHFNSRAQFDVREFIAEAMSNPRLQALLARTRASEGLVTRLGLDKKTTLWRAMVSAITRALGLGEKHVTLLDAAMHLGDEAMAYEPPQTSFSKSELVSAIRSPSRDVVQSFASGNRTGEMLQRAVEEAPHVSDAMRSKIRSLGLHLGTTHQIAQMAESYFGAGSPAMKLWAAAKKMVHAKGEILEASGARKLIADVAALERKLTPDQMDRFGEFLRDETMAEVFADRPLDQQKGVTSQGKAQYGELRARYNALSPDEKAMRSRLHGYFKSQQEEAGLATIKAVIRAINPNGEADDALAQKIFTNKLSDAEKRVLDRHYVMRALRNARAMTKVTGPYVPLMRHGDHVVSGTYNVPAPKGAVRLNEEGVKDAKGNVYQFSSREAATAFAEQAPVKVTREQRVYVDPATGERFATDPATGERVRLTKEDWAANTADEKWRVTLQPKHVEFFDSEVAARRRHAELAAHDFGPDLQFELDGVAPRRWEPTGSNASFMSATWERALNSLRQRGGFQALDPNARRELENHLIELSLSSLGSTRAQSRRLPRTFVKGASGDVQRGLGQYASSMSGFLARQAHAPEVDRLIKQLQQYERDHAYEDTSKTYARGQILKEFQQRLFAQGEPERNSVTDTVVSRMLQMSQMDKLASPAFHVINSMEPWTTSLPVIAGKYGFGRTLAAMHRAYADIGAPTILGKGLADTAKAFRTEQGLTDYITTLKDRVAGKQYGKDFVDVLDEMGHLGVISRDAGMEVARMSTPGSNIVGRGLDRADLMARQMGTAVESINRFVTARAEYVLAREAGLDHEAAKLAAINRTVDTMGDYSQWNASPIFRHPLGRLALQFKKFAQKTYYILGKTALQALRGDPEGMKAFAGLMATHGLLAGALGLPLEAIHAGMLAAQLTGITSSNYGDFEQWMRNTAAKNLGVGFGEIATRGLPRYMGVDVSSRFSLADLVFPLGDPKSLKQDDLLAYAAKAFGGAPLSLIAEYPRGVQALLRGDVVEASRILVPIKLYADSVTAYQRASVGRQTASGREKMSPYTTGEAFTRSMGFAPAREAEQTEAYSAQYGDQQAFKRERGTLMNNWVTAKGDDKAKAWRQIMEWNAKQPPAAKITLGEAQRNFHRRQLEERNSQMKGGLRTTKRDAFVREQEKFYNVH